MLCTKTHITGVCHGHAVERKAGAGDGGDVGDRSRGRAAAGPGRAEVLVHGRDAARGAETVEEITAAGGKASFVAATGDPEAARARRSFW